MLRHMGEQGPIAVYTRNLLDALLAAGGSHEYLLLYRDPRLVGSYGGRPNVREIVLTASSKLAWDQFRTVLLERRERPDLIFQPKLSVPLAASCPTVFVLHGVEPFAVPGLFPWHNRLYNRLLMPVFCRRAAAVISTTQTGTVDIARLIGADTGNIHVIHQAQHERFRPVPAPEADRVLARHGVTGRYVLFVSELNRLENLDTLLRAWALARRDLPHALVAVGYGGKSFDRSRSLAAGLGLGGAVLFPGPVPDEDLPALYSRADLLIYPSLYEGFGVRLLEAMACGCPVAASHTGSCAEIAGEAAVLFNPRDPASIFGAVREALESDEARARMARRGLKRASGFSWNRTARQTLDLFARVVESARG